MKKIIMSLLLIGILSSCSSDDSNLDTQEFIPGEILVGIKSGIDIKEIFDFINQFELEVDHINSLSFTSNLPPDSLQDILDNLNQKDYTNDGVNWFVNGYLHAKTNDIWIFPRLFDMHTVDYQQDWLMSMVELELKDKHNPELNSGIIQFKVPEGQEYEWEKKFESLDIVDWAELNYVADIELYKN